MRVLQSTYDEVVAERDALAKKLGGYLFTTYEVSQAMEVLRGRHGSTALIAEVLDEMERCLLANADDE